jgi:hypothetical protein
MLRYRNFNGNNNKCSYFLTIVYVSFHKSPEQRQSKLENLKKGRQDGTQKREQKRSQFFDGHVHQLLDHCMGDVQCC